MTPSPNKQKKSMMSPHVKKFGDIQEEPLDYDFDYGAGPSETVGNGWESDFCSNYADEGDQDYWGVGDGKEVDLRSGYSLQYNQQQQQPRSESKRSGWDAVADEEQKK